jgi:hypothetical protein
MHCKMVCGNIDLLGAVRQLQKPNIPGRGLVSILRAGQKGRGGNNCRLWELELGSVQSLIHSYYAYAQP